MESTSKSFSCGHYTTVQGIMQEKNDKILQNLTNLWHPLYRGSEKAASNADAAYFRIRFQTISARNGCARNMTPKVTPNTTASSPVFQLGRMEGNSFSKICPRHHPRIVPTVLVIRTTEFRRKMFPKEPYTTATSMRNWHPKHLEMADSGRFLTSSKAGKTRREAEHQV